MAESYKRSSYLDGQLFTTTAGVEYFLLFKEEQETLFPALPQLQGHIFSLAFFPLNEADFNYLPSDARVAATIVDAILESLKEDRNIVIFIADHYDKRQRARKRKFETWLTKYSLPGAETFTGSIKVDDADIMTALIIPNTHPLKEVVVYQFLVLMQGFSK